MELYSLILSKDSCWEAMDELGKKNILHFLNLNEKNPAYTNPFIQSIRRCDETERKIKYFS